MLHRIREIVHVTFIFMIERLFMKSRPRLREKEALGGKQEAH